LTLTNIFARVPVRSKLSCDRLGPWPSVGEDGNGGDKRGRLRLAPQVHYHDVEGEEEAEMRSASFSHGL